MNCMNLQKKNGAKSGKLIGAGGGGFFLFLVDNPKDKIKLIKSLKKNIYVPVKFSEQGTKIIYKQDEYIQKIAKNKII